MLKQAALVLLLAGSAWAGPPTAVDKLIDEGSRKFEAGDLDGALAAFERAGQLAPKDARPLYLRGAALQKKGDAPGAEKGFRAALALDPTLAEVRGELGALLLEQKRFGDAANELRMAVKGKPDFLEGWYNLGQAELAQKKCPPALDAFKKATQLQPADADGWINLSVAQRKCAALPDSLTSARQAVKVAAPGSPAEGPAQLNLGLVLHGLGKHDEASAPLYAATQKNPKSATAWWTLGLVERERKRPKEAVAALKTAVELKPTAAHLTDLGLALRDTNDLDGALEKFRAAADRDPRYVPARWQLAQALAAKGQCKEALKELEGLPPEEKKSDAAAKLRLRCTAK
jgi:tetratricopeptide (TPR) repeat protein